MFVSVVLDPSGAESAKELSSVLSSFGFNKVQRACWECLNISKNQLAELKRKIDGVTDSYDCVRFYQYPIQDKFIITELRHKKWKKCVLASSLNPDS